MARAFHSLGLRMTASEPGSWTARCFEYDFFGHGLTEIDAREALRVAIDLHAEADVASGRLPFDTLERYEGRTEEMLLAPYAPYAPERSP